MENMLLKEVEYKITKTSFGTWRRFMYPSGASFAEFTSHQSFFGLPLMHYTYGKSPETGHRIIAKGIIAIGRLATGVFAIGQLAVGIAAGIGQLATGFIAIGQLGLGHYVVAQKGYGNHVIDSYASDPVAVDFFK